MNQEFIDVINPLSDIKIMLDNKKEQKEIFDGSHNIDLNNLSKDEESIKENIILICDNFDYTNKAFVDNLLNFVFVELRKK